MEVGRAIQKLEKAGFAVTEVRARGYIAQKEGVQKEIRFSKDSETGETSCVYIRKAGDYCKSMSDYFDREYFGSDLSAAMRALR